MFKIIHYNILCTDIYISSHRQKRFLVKLKNRLKVEQIKLDQSGKDPFILSPLFPLKY
jgi:hypothetical protein